MVNFHRVVASALSFRTQVGSIAKHFGKRNKCVANEVDSSEMAFKIAGSMGFRSGATKADPVILEPYMKVEVTVPEDYMGDVIWCRY